MEDLLAAPRRPPGRTPIPGDDDYNDPFGRGIVYPTPTRTPTPTREPTPTRVPTQTPTPRPTQTPKPTWTPVPTQTPRPTNTPRPTETPRPTQTPTREPTPTRTPTPYPTLPPARPNAGPGARGGAIVIPDPPPGMPQERWDRIWNAVMSDAETADALNAQNTGQRLSDRQRQVLVEASNDVRGEIARWQRGLPFEPLPGEPGYDQWIAAQGTPTQASPTPPPTAEPAPVGTPEPADTALGPIQGPPLPPDIGPPTSAGPGPRPDFRGPPPDVAPFQDDQREPAAPPPTPTLPSSRPAADEFGYTPSTAAAMAPRPAPPPPPPIRGGPPPPPPVAPATPPTAPGTARTPPPPPPPTRPAAPIPAPRPPAPPEPPIRPGPLRTAIEAAGGTSGPTMARDIARGQNAIIAGGYQGMDPSWRVDAQQAASAWEDQYRSRPDTLDPSEKAAYQRDPGSLRRTILDPDSPFANYRESWIGAFRNGELVPQARAFDADLRAAGGADYRSPYRDEPIPPPAPAPYPPAVSEAPGRVGDLLAQAPASIGPPEGAPIVPPATMDLSAEPSMEAQPAGAPPMEAPPMEAPPMEAPPEEPPPPPMEEAPPEEAPPPEEETPEEDQGEDTEEASDLDLPPIDDY